MNPDNEDIGAPKKTSRSQPEGITNENSPECILLSSAADASTTLSVPAHTKCATSTSFETAIEGGTTVVAPLDLPGSMEESLDKIIAEDTVEVARGGSEKENTDNAEGNGPYP